MTSRRTRVWTVVRILSLVALAVLVMGTSRPLDWKDLRGTLAEAPAGLVAEVPPAAFLGENVNNQGCSCREETLDLLVVARLRNEGAREVRLEERRVVVVVDGRELPLRQGSYSIGDETHRYELRELVLGPGETGEFRAYSQSFRPRSALTSVDRLEVIVPSGEERLRLVFENVGSVPVQTGSANSNTWNPDW
jgi:hypothetical protein